jgi:hypothetical protein
MHHQSRPNWAPINAKYRAVSAPRDAMHVGYLAARLQRKSQSVFLGGDGRECGQVFV